MDVAQRLSSVEEFVGRYTAEDGWWRLDLWALETSALAQDLSDEDRRRFLLPAWVAYGDYLDRVNRAFAEMHGYNQQEILGRKPNLPTSLAASLQLSTPLKRTMHSLDLCVPGPLL